jgi:hypothetical protein
MERDCVNGTTFCQECLDNRKEYYENLKKNKKCVNHPDRDVVNGVMCQECVDNMQKRYISLFNQWNNILKERGMDKCLKCGYNGCAIDLHHRNMKEKEIGIAILKHLKITPKRLLELDKCDALCRNCHAELHFEIRNHTERIFKWYNLQEKINFNKCVTCGYNKCIAVIDAHHINPEKKEFEISNLKCKPFNYENTMIFLNEIKKCIPMCKNCHTELEKNKNE